MLTRFVGATAVNGDGARLTGVTPFVGTAGWSIPRDVAARFPGEGSLLERYARVFPCAEINSTFYRSHRASTYARWRESVPSHFRFSVKIPRTISHDKQLIGAETEFAAFLVETQALGDKRGPLLLQLPPSLCFDPGSAAAFFVGARQLFDGDFIIEPRHPSWFSSAASELFQSNAIHRVCADPPIDGDTVMADVDGDLTYLRLHGSPKVYFSAYRDLSLHQFAEKVGRATGSRWVIFDNTASGAAATDALSFLALVVA